MIALVTTLLAVPSPDIAPAEHGRKLSYTSILAYSPGSGVTDHANIDLDQKAIESELSAGDFSGAKDIYTDGAHSKPTAVCTLVSPATAGAAIAKKAPVSFTTNNGDAVTGKAYSTYDAAAAAISFTYPVSSSRVQPPSSACYVGGLEAGDQQISGCIAGSSGSAASGLGAGESTFTIDTTTYTATCVNKGKRTLQGFSTKAQAVMYDCPKDSSVSYENGCPYTSYKPYYDYYGVYDYANQLVLAGLDGTAITTFTNGNVDLTAAGDDVKSQFVKKGTAYLSAWMYAIREFEDAIDDCTSGDLTANALSSGPVHAWDEGVGFYTGSLMTYDDLLAGNLPTLDSKGKMPYTLGNKRCKNFVTCGPDGDSRVGEAKANMELFKLFHLGQHKLLVGDCAAVVPIKDAIVQQATVPLVQGTLRYAYKMAALQGNKKAKAEGHVFAAAVLPQLHACDPTVAKTVQDELNQNSDDDVDFNAVKAGIESCYPSMGITCEDVGGLWNTAESKYYNDKGFDASPCVSASPPPPPAPDQTGMLVGIIAAAAVAVIFLLCLCYMFSREKAGKPIFTSIANPKAGSA